MSKKKVSKRLFAAMLATVVMVAMIMVPQAAYADGADTYCSFGKKMTVSKSSEDLLVMINMGKRLNGAKSVTVKSSNKKVCSYIADFPEAKALFVSVGKKGTAKLTIKVTTSKGTKTYKGKLKVVAFKSPVKKATLGGKSITKGFKKKNGDIIYYGSMTAKSNLNIKPKKGWKVKSVKFFSGGKGITKKNKSNYTIDWSKCEDSVVVTMYKKSKKQTEYFFIIPQANYY